MKRIVRFVIVLEILLAASASASAAPVWKMARDYAPRVVLHPQERYGIANVYHFFKKFRLVLDTPLKKVRFDVNARNIHRIVHQGWTRRYRTTDRKWKDHWYFESRDGCQWSSTSKACDAVYLRASNPVRTYARRVRPHVYWRARRRSTGGKKYTVIQYFFLMMLNDAQNKHDGEWESSVVVVDDAAYDRAGTDVSRKRAAIEQILMAGHYHHTPYPAATLRKYASRVFVPGTAHYRHVMSLGGHGGYLLVPKSGRHEASMQCYERVAKSRKHYDVWAAPVRLVRVTSETPWLKYVGRWGRRYGLLAKLPMKFRFSFKPFGDCKGRFGLGWLKSRFQVIGSAPFGPRFIHQTAWRWKSFPRPPGPTPKAWR